MKAKIVEYNENNFAVKKETGEYICTFHSTFGTIPMLWSKEYNTKKFIAEVVKDSWGIKIVEKYFWEENEEEPEYKKEKTIFDGEDMTQEEIKEMLDFIKSI